MDKAPFFSDIARGPRGGGAVWAQTHDGIRIRLGLWPAAHGTSEKGTVFLLPGRTEYIEKFGPGAADLSARGYHTLAVDWRGQGLAERLYHDRNLSHVDHFDEYQADLKAMCATAEAMGLPQPWYLLCHSMGGCIGLRALQEEQPFVAAAFSAPMWGILFPPPLQPVAWGIAWVSHHSRMGMTYAPGTRAATYVDYMPFEGNNLTTDPDMYAFMQEQSKAYPDLVLGGPSMTWLLAALNETKALMQNPAPDVPAMAYLGTRERIVFDDPIKRYMAKWPAATLTIVKDAEHEILMELPATRDGFYADADALFTKASAALEIA